jgi:hypothetical protein
MQLLAGSLNVEVSGFLHAGYLSAFPSRDARTFHFVGKKLLATRDVKLIDVKKALELKETTPYADTATAVQPAFPTPRLHPAALIPESTGLVIAALFFGCLVSIYFLRMRQMARPWLVTVMLLAAVLVYRAPAMDVHFCNFLPRPWRGVPVRQYKDPQAATEVILHALVANAVAGSPPYIKNLAAVQCEVAFPVPEREYTPGMRYAQQTYGRDGWGREFSFVPYFYRFRITSAGPDGVFGTPDDITLFTAACDHEWDEIERHDYADSWEHRVGGVYCRRVNGHDVVLIHRVSDRCFVAAHPDYAQKLTGADLFDAFLPGELTYASQDELPILAELEERRASVAGKESGDPLFFARFGTKNQ